MNLSIFRTLYHLHNTPNLDTFSSNFRYNGYLSYSNGCKRSMKHKMNILFLSRNIIISLVKYSIIYQCWLLSFLSHRSHYSFLCDSFFWHFNGFFAPKVDSIFRRESPITMIFHWKELNSMAPVRNQYHIICRRIEKANERV